MRRGLLFIAVLASSCGRAAPTPTNGDWTGSWRSASSVPGSFVTMTLSGTGTSIAGTGVQHVEAGRDRNFTVHGTSTRVPGPGVTFTYDDGATEGLTFAQPDAGHLVLSNASRTLNFTREYPFRLPGCCCLLQRRL